MKLAFVTDTGTGQHPDYWKEKGIYCTIEENNGEKYLEIIWEG